ncbi:2,4'-dihydroxyacetophenone dioxygenase [Fonsecaea pedrosoi]|nr:2,4'-dihydroxyacetophenone dioxygenase [Fonsecaea pedrosoi]
MMGSTTTTTRPEAENVAYRGEPLPNVSDDLVVLNTLKLGCDENLWVPQTKNVWFPPFAFQCQSGILCDSTSSSEERDSVATPTLRAPCMPPRFEDGGTISNTTGGRRKAALRSKPPGDIHTLEVPNGVKEMITLFHVTGAYIYVDPDGVPQGVEDVFSKLQLAKEHYKRVGLGENFVDQFIR